ncbi:hypothetical protein TTHERM_00522210 (macronuclear) [Tetrahymena thermophila SB210]|uniref:Uncharacterized protein n=1 Tax=Tetrahymena thermophila (strain SB210) TaxID=312017 RepID=I7M7L1_TETTS|nr:hypothetical protein TTHERM_00522210 [Tetrahymena thermophila SB210]EAR94154.3 hypothetical protein TTHERM_00522210 [Tetrahymena thermophila SB210]|eukprot:XP_001014399.3 hypothetical protein TTHERM_00522210 [Tetrahymena thermophila SB210]
MSASSEIQSQIDLQIKSESVSVNVFSLMKICSKVQSIAQSKEELEKYYVKNFKDVKGFFSVSYLTHNNQQLISAIVDEIELQDISKNQQNKIVEVSLIGVCSFTKNLTISDFKLTISNLEAIDMYNIQINEKDKYREISNNKQQTIQNSQVEAQSNLKQSQQSQSTKRKLQIEDSDDDDGNTKNQLQNKQIKTNGSLVSEVKNTSPRQNEKQMEVEASDDEDNDQEFIAQHLKRIVVQDKNSKKEEQTKANTQNSNKNNAKQSSKTPAAAGNSKITSFFKKK